MTTAVEARPLISIVVPTHGRPRQLASCLAALAAVDYPRDRFEVIVVDDDSPDPVAGTVAAFEDRLDVRVIRCPRRGPAAARNRGALVARGSVLAFTDDDCLPDRQWLGALAAAMNGGQTAVGGKTTNAAPVDLCAIASQAIVDWAYAYYNAGSAGPRFFASNNLAVPREKFLDVGGFDETFTTAEDRELCDRWRHSGLALAYASNAQVAHAVELSITAFARRYFAYGRGAYRFNAVRRRRGSGSLLRDLSFYVQLPRRVAELLRALGPARSGALVGLLGLWQLANTAGFFWEAARGRTERARPRRAS